MPWNVLKATKCPARPSLWPRWTAAPNRRRSLPWKPPTSNGASSRCPSAASAPAPRWMIHPCRPPTHRWNPPAAEAARRPGPELLFFDRQDIQKMSAALHKIAIAGASGRMGRMLLEAVQAADDCVLAGALDVPTSPALGSGVNITADLRAGLQGAQVLIDFTRPEGTLAHLKVCRELGVKAVIGTTGFSDAQKAEIAEISRDIAIMMAPNMSVGVNVTLKLLQMAAKALSTGYDIEIIEAHHRHKVDAPSGTALKMGEVIADALGRDLKECAVYAR